MLIVQKWAKRKIQEESNKLSKIHQLKIISISIGDDGNGYFFYTDMQAGWMDR